MIFRFFDIGHYHQRPASPPAPAAARCRRRPAIDTGGRDQPGIAIRSAIRRCIGHSRTQPWAVDVMADAVSGAETAGCPYPRWEKAALRRSRPRQCGRRRSVYLPRPSSLPADSSTNPSPSRGGMTARSASSNSPDNAKMLGQFRAVEIQASCPHAPSSSRGTPPQHGLARQV
jgi:hypothetical protein